MITSEARPWLVGALVRDRKDTTDFALLMVVGYLPDGQVQTVSITPPPWSTRAERRVRSCSKRTLQSFHDLAPPDGE